MKRAALALVLCLAAPIAAAQQPVVPGFSTGIGQNFTPYSSTNPLPIAVPNGISAGSQTAPALGTNLVSTQTPNLVGSSTLQANNATNNCYAVTTPASQDTVSWTITNLTGTGASIEFYESADAINFFPAAIGGQNIVTVDGKYSFNAAGMQSEQACVVVAGSNTTVTVAVSAAAGDRHVSMSGLPIFTGSTTVVRPNNTTAYTGSQLQANNTAGNAVPASLTLTGTIQGTGYIVRALAQSSTTTAGTPPIQTWWLYNAAPTVTGLHDGSAYIGPYAADLSKYVGSISCGSWQKTNDATAQWFSPCTTNNPITAANGALPFVAQSGTTTLQALLETGSGGYTPNANEVETLYVWIDRKN